MIEQVPSGEEREGETEQGGVTAGGTSVMTAVHTQECARTPRHTLPQCEETDPDKQAASTLQTSLSPESISSELPSPPLRETAGAFCVA